jgi:hypothetical protein
VLIDFVRQWLLLLGGGKSNQGGRLLVVFDWMETAHLPWNGVSATDRTIFLFSIWEKFLFFSSAGAGWEENFYGNG